MKGIVLAGGTGSRLYPITKCISKQILPIYDKPMIYYPISTLLLAGIKDILIISTAESMNQYKQLLGDGDNIGAHFTYIIQKKPKGLAEAFLLGEDFIGDDSVCLVLGDNIFFGQDFSTLLGQAVKNNIGATIFGYPVNNPKDFGVVEFDQDYNVIDIEEKPEAPKSNYAVPGLYFYDNSVIKYAKKVIPSKRGELEITSINNMYLNDENLKVILMGRGMAWFDTGTPKGLLGASQFVETVQERQGFYISCIEEIAWRKGFINNEKLKENALSLENTEYGQYLLSLLEKK